MTKWKIFFRSSGKKWCTHVGFYNDLDTKDREVARLCSAFKEVKVRTFTEEDTIIK